MIHGRVIIFLVIASIFAATHYFALVTHSYSFIWWFDSVMHFWGGTLIGLGVHAFSTFSRIHIKPTLPVVLIVLALATSTWEVFEWYAGLWLTEGYLLDTVKDIVLGFSGGLLAHLFLSKRTIES